MSTRAPFDEVPVPLPAPAALGTPVPVASDGEARTLRLSFDLLAPGATAPLILVVREGAAVPEGLPVGACVVHLEHSGARVAANGASEARALHPGRPLVVAGCTLRLGDERPAGEGTVFDRSSWASPELRISRDGERSANLCCRLPSSPDAALLVGRGGNGVDLSLDDEFVSRRHARFFQERGATYVEDLGSRGGTFVNGARIDARAALKHRDVVRVGETSLELCCYADLLRELDRRRDEPAPDPLEPAQNAAPAPAPPEPRSDTALVVSISLLAFASAAFWTWRSLTS